MIFKKIADFSFDAVLKGSVNNVDDFIEQVVKKQFIEHKEVIKSIHKELVNYIKQDNATYFLRLYGSFSKDKYNYLRRGFLSKYKCNNRLVFCDNTFSMLFAGAKLSNIPYTVEDLNTLFRGSSLICSFGFTSSEKELCYYNREEAYRVNLNGRGWYLAHLNAVGKDYVNEPKGVLKDTFINPDRNQWNEKTRIREVEEELSPKELKLLQAHFLRLIHPLNSFLVPKRTQLEYIGNNIGEENELLFKVQEFIKQEFKEEYVEFCKLALVEEISLNNQKRIEEIKWKKSDFSKRKKVVKEQINLILKEIEEEKSKDKLENMDDINDLRSEILKEKLSTVG
ncbi:hypothetical protein, partial [Myroides sp. LoEW2-1]